MEIQIGRQRRKATARLMQPTDPERLWEIVNANNHDRYSAYQKQTSRPIAVIVVTPT